MSYDIRLKDPRTGETLELEEPHGIAGGTYAPGDTECWLNVTYNYARLFHLHLDQEKGIRSLYGQTGAEAIPRLQAAIASLEALGPMDAMREEDYWAPTPLHAARALRGLLAFAEARPEGVFDGD